MPRLQPLLGRPARAPRIRGRWILFQALAVLLAAPWSAVLAASQLTDSHALIAAALAAGGLAVVAPAYHVVPALIEHFHRTGRPL